MINNKMSTATGIASEDADDRAEAIMRKSMGTRPGAFAYAALALFTAMAILGAVITIQVTKDRAKAAVKANCETVDASNRVLVEVIGELTAPRILSSSATPEQIVAQEETNKRAFENREAKLAKLQTLECGELGETTNLDVISVPAEPPPAVIVGPDGEVGPTGLTGLIGPNGKPGLMGATGPSGSQGTAGADGDDGKDGRPGRDGVDGKIGPEGPPAPTTTMPTTTTTQPLLGGASTRQRNQFCFFGLCL